MKSTRKLASLLLALVMVFALATTVFATEIGETTTTPVTGTITVENPKSETTYTAYKIFDVVYDDAKVNYSYTIKDDSDWYNTVSAYTTGLTLIQVEGTNTYVVTTTSDFSPAAFADALKKALDAAPTAFSGTPLTKSGTPETASATVNELGYYFVSSDSGALCNLTTTDPHAKIYDKTDVPFKKEVEKNNYDVGQDVTFTIKGKVPDYTGFKTYTYLITDTMTEGLTFNKNVTVTVDGTDVTNACITSYDVRGNTNKFTVSIPVKVNVYKIGAEIVVTYTATVNKKAIAEISTNEAKLTYSNNPTTDELKDSEPVVQKVYTSKIVIEKVEENTEGTSGKKLEGAEFVLYKEEKPAGGGEATKTYYKWNDTDKKVDWVADKSQADVKKTDVKGEASFDGLADGTYYLVETKAPAGYNQLDKPVKVEVHDGEHNAPVTDKTQLTVNATVKNKAGTLLPSTGGMGTTVFYVLGAILVVGAGVLLVTKKRMSQGEI